MGYRIEYGPPREKTKKGGRWVNRFQVMTAGFLLLFVLLVRQAWPEGTAKLREFLLPGAQTSQAAFQTMVEDIRDGETVREALTAFCQQIIDDGQENVD